jgi:hypothetical protein
LLLREKNGEVHFPITVEVPHRNTKEVFPGTEVHRRLERPMPFPNPEDTSVKAAWESTVVRDASIPLKDRNNLW